MVAKWLTRIVWTIHDAALERRILFTHKALSEMADLGCDREDVREVLLGLDGGDFHRRIASQITDEWLYEFKPLLGAEVVYLKVALRDGCVLISFHEDRDED